MKISWQRFFRLGLYLLSILCVDALIKFFTVRCVSLMPWASPFYPYGGIAVFRDFLGIDFTINYVANRGGAWGIFSNWHEHLVVVRISAILALAIYLLYINLHKERQIPLVLIIAGATGNVIDSFIYGHVVDMFHFYIAAYSCPVFNIADASIFFGVVTMLIQSLRKKEQAPTHEQSFTPFQ